MFPKLGVAFLTGAFASVMNPETLQNPGFLVLSGFFSFILYLLTKKLFLDIGGRPGTLAYLGNSLTFLIIYLGSLSGNYEYKTSIILIDHDYYKSLNVFVYIFGPLISVVAAILVDLIALFNKDLILKTNRLLPYAMVTCLGCMLLLMIKIEYRQLSSGKIETYGELFINYLNIGTISGITGRSRFLSGRNYAYYFFNYVFICLFCAFIGLGTMGILRVGGKHGIVSFLGNVIIIYSRDFIFGKQKGKENKDNDKDKIFNNKDTENLELKILDKENNNNIRKRNFDFKSYGANEIHIQRFEFSLEKRDDI